MSIIRKRLTGLFLRSEPEVQLEGYKKGKATTFGFFPLKISKIKDQNSTLSKSLRQATGERSLHLAKQM